MRGDFEALTRINHDITIAEDKGDADALKRYLAPAVAFRRANGTVVDRDGFLEGVKPSGPRELTIQSIALLGQQRALVTCIVSMSIGGRPATFDNARLFVRTNGGDWQLIGWANEPEHPAP